MWRLPSLALLTLLLSASAFGQFTTTSGTITDTPDGQAWFGGSFSFVFRVSPSNPTAQYFFNGVPFSSAQTIAGALDGSGHYSVSVPSNTSITPAGSTWDLTVCPLATATCFTVQSVSITGATQTVSPTPPSIRINLSSPPQNPRAYQDGELVNGALGQTYFNITSTVIRVCSVFPCGWTNSSGGTSITLETNGTINAVQSLLNIKAGTAITTTADGSGGVTIASTIGPPSGAQGVVQAANGIGGFHATNLTEAGGVLTNGDQNSNRGPNPGVDITAPPFNGRAVNPNFFGSTTGTITTGTNSLSLASITNFQIGDGIVGMNMGPTNCATQPSAPTAFAGLASTMTGTGWMVAGGTGSTSVSYTISAISAYPFANNSTGNCYTAASPVVTVSNSNDAMGAKQLPVTSQSIAVGSNTVTVTVGSTTGFPNNFWGLIDGTTDNQEFGGYRHFTIVDGTHLSYQSTFDSRYFITSTSATGGTLYYKAGNHLTFPALPAGTGMKFWAVWRCIGASCALPANAANFSLVYVSYPADLGYTDTTYNTWDDFGTTMTGTLSPGGYSWFLPTTPPATNVNDALIAQITDIAGATLTLSANAGNSATSSPVRFGNDYAILTAQAAIPKTVTGGGGSLHFPPPVENPATGAFCYVTSAYLPLSTFVDNLGGVPCATVTWNIGGTNLNGTTEDSSRMVAGQFSKQTELDFRCVGANPCIMRNGGSIKNLTIESFTPGAMLIFDQSGDATVTDNINFEAGGGGCMDILYYSYGGTQSGFGGPMTNTSWSMGPTQVVGSCDTPAFISKNNTQWHFNDIFGNRRGLYLENNAVATPGFLLSMKMGGEWQGPITPLVTLNMAVGGNSNGLIYLEHLFQDSGEMPLFVLSNTGGTIGAPLFINQANAPGNMMPIISGDVGPGGISLSTSAPLINNQAGTNHDLIQCNGQENRTNGQGYTGCSLPSLNLATVTVGGNITLTGSMGTVVETATGTITVPHALAGQTWFVYCQAGVCTIAIDSGSLFGNPTVSAGTGVFVTADGTNAHIGGGGGGGGGIPANPSLSVQYNQSGSFGAIPVPTAPNGVAQSLTSTPSGGVGTTGGFHLAGVAPRVTVCPSNLDTVLATDRAGLVEWNDASACAVTLPQAGSGSGGNNDFTTNFVFLGCNIGVGIATITPTTSTLTVLNNGVVTTPANLPLSKGQCAFFYSDNTNYTALQVTSSGLSQVQTNTVNNTSQTLLNLTNSAATNGLTLTVTNTSGGVVQLGYTGTLNNSGLTNSFTTVNGQTCTLGSTCTIPPGTITVANASSTGTSTSTLTKLVGAPSTAVIMATTDTSGVVGITTSGAGTTGSAVIQLLGLVNCTFDGATVAGDYVQISSTVAGNCHDTNSSSYPLPGTGAVIGRVLTTNASVGTFQIDLFSPEINVSKTATALGSGSGTAGQLACVTASNTQGNCTATPPVTFLGVFLAGGTTYVSSGIASVVIDATQNVTFGDILCASTIAGKSHDNGSVGCANGQWVGQVVTTATSTSTVTANVRLQ